jgi:hypothetical protein
MAPRKRVTEEEQPAPKRGRKAKEAPEESKVAPAEEIEKARAY